MTKLARALALTTALAALTGGAVTLAAAQDKARTAQKKDDKKPTGRTTGIVEVNEGKDGKFRLVIRDSDETFLATSAAFATKDDALKGLEKIRKAVENPKVTDKKSDKDKEK